MSNRLRVHEINNPGEYYADNEEVMNALGADAFGRKVEDFAPDVKSHFKEAAHGQAITEDNEPVGFALYGKLGNGDILWLQGIAVDRRHQGSGIGRYAVTEASNDSRLLVATTRNPATVKLIGGVTSLACPDIRLTDPLRHLEDETIQYGLSVLGETLGADDQTIPYLLGRYPDGLYGDDPGKNMPLAPIAENPNNAVMVAGAK